MTLSRSRFVTLPLALVLCWSIAQIESASAPTPNHFYTISAQPQCTNVIIQIYGRFLPIAHPSPGSVPFPPEVIGELPPDTPTCHLGYPMMADPSQRIHVESEQLYGQIRQTFKHDPVHARLVYQDHNVTSITILAYAFAGTILDRALATEVFDTDPFSSILFSTIGGVLYLGTPHSGSSFLASLPRSVGSFLLEAPLLRDLASPECAKTYKKVLDRNFNILNVVEDTAVSYESASKYDQSRVPELERALFSSEVPIKIVPEAEAHPTVVGKSAIHVSSFLATGLNHLDLSSITNANPELVKTVRQFVLGAGRLAAPRFCNDNLVKSMISSYPRFLLWVPTANQYVYCDGTFTSAINPEVNGLPTIAITAAGRPRRVRSPSYILPLPSFARFETSSSCEDGPAAIYGRGHSFETHNGLRTVHGHRSSECKLRCLMRVDTGAPQSEVVIRASAEGVGPNKGDPLPTISINNDPIGRKTDHRTYATQHGTCDKLWCTSSEWLLQEERGDLIHTLPSRTSSFEVAMTCESNGSFLSATCRIAKLGFR